MSEKMVMDYIGIGRRIRRARKAERMTQEALSKAVGISISFLGHIERGTRKMSLETFSNLCKYLRLNPYYVLNGVQGPELSIIQELEIQNAITNLTDELIERVMGIYFVPYDD